MLWRLPIISLTVAFLASCPPFAQAARQSAATSSSQPQAAAPAAEIPDDCAEAARQQGGSQIRSLPDATPADSARSEALDVLGRSFGKRGNFRCALAAFEAASSLDPDSFQSRYDLALAFLSTRQAQRAADELRILLKAHPDSCQAHNALGLALRDVGDAQSAQQEYEAALRTCPQFASASYNLGQLLLDEKKYPAALRQLQAALSDSPSPELALDTKVALAAAFAQTGDYEHAVPLLQEAVLLKPDSAELHFDLATALAHREDYRAAVAEYTRTLQIAPDHDGALLSLSKALMNESAVDQAIPYL